VLIVLTTCLDNIVQIRLSQISPIHFNLIVHGDDHGDEIACNGGPILDFLNDDVVEVVAFEVITQL